jgi:hypothetical protein
MTTPARTSYTEASLEDYLSDAPRFADESTPAVMEESADDAKTARNTSATDSERGHTRPIPVDPPESSSRPATPRPKRPRKRVTREPWTWRRTYSYYGLHLQHILRLGGTLQRYVVIDDVRLRQLLGQPRRREIEPLRARQAHFELNTSELWELAEAQAIPALREIYTRAHSNPRESSDEPQLARTRSPHSDNLVAPVDTEQAARGILLHASKTSDGRAYVIYLWEPQELQLLRVYGMDLKGGWQKTRARPGELIQVIPRSSQTVAIEEQRSGVHGHGRRTLRRKHTLFEVYRVDSPGRGSMDEGRDEDPGAQRGT